LRRPGLLLRFDARLLLRLQALALGGVVEDLEAKEDREREHDRDQDVAHFVGPGAAAVLH
jgi:hypothetical protein